jgi:hypothetical protein
VIQQKANRANKVAINTPPKAANITVPNAIIAIKINANILPNFVSLACLSISKRSIECLWFARAEPYPITSQKYLDKAPRIVPSFRWEEGHAYISYELG